jgi:hypothetical protein
VLGEAAVEASRTDTFLGERYRRIAPDARGKKKAVVAVGRSILVIIWSPEFLTLARGGNETPSPLNSRPPRLFGAPARPVDSGTTRVFWLLMLVAVMVGGNEWTRFANGRRARCGAVRCGAVRSEASADPR